MKVKMLRTESGRHPEYGTTGQYHCLTGHEYEVPDELGKAWVKGGVATKVRAPKKEEETKAEPKKGVKNGD